MTLVDTSVWVEYDRATGSAADRRLNELLATDAELFTTNPIEMELMVAGPNRLAARRLLLGVDSIPFESEADFPAAARLYAACRAVGATPRGLIDCMIAAVALRADVPLLARERDFRSIADVSALELVAV